MQGNWNNRQAYYRCRFPAQYAIVNATAPRGRTEGDFGRPAHQRRGDQVDDREGRRLGAARRTG
ncbi:hypothetical protein [Nonomuraea roseoviolacea]|uniref:hypothetical protein n=1 Tax=Nonomuraea roseoviolacea TaxID=103837 RepID=UPI003B590250